MIEGCLNWQKCGLARPPEIERQVEAYRSDMDLIQQWLDEACIIEASGNTRAALVYASYRHWASDNGHRSTSNQKFAQKLKDRGFNKGHDRNGAFYQGLTIRQGCF